MLTAEGGRPLLPTAKSSTQPPSDLQTIYTNTTARLKRKEALIPCTSIKAALASVIRTPPCAARSHRNCACSGHVHTFSSKRRPCAKSLPTQQWCGANSRSVALFDSIMLRMTSHVVTLECCSYCVFEHRRNQRHRCQRSTRSINERSN